MQAGTKVFGRYVTVDHHGFPNTSVCSRTGWSNCNGLNTARACNITMQCLSSVYNMFITDNALCLLHRQLAMLHPVATVVSLASGTTSRIHGRVLVVSSDSCPVVPGCLNVLE